MSFSRIINIGTDVAALFIFHPDDLKFAAEWPIAWYSMPAVWRHQSAAKRLVCWQTGGDGGYVVRVTSDELTDRETAYAASSWIFPYEVRHGKVFVDNSDALPGEEQRDAANTIPRRWVDIPNGDYAVKVTAIEWTAETNSKTGQSKVDELPSYVVQFLPAQSQAPIVAVRSPDIICMRGEEASDKLYPGTAANSETSDSLYPERDKHDLTTSLSAVCVDHLQPVGGQVSTHPHGNVEQRLDADAKTSNLFSIPFVIGPAIQEGAFALLADIKSWGGSPGERLRVGFRLLGPVQIKKVDGSFEKGTVRRLKRILFSVTAKPHEPYTDLLYAVTVKPYNPLPLDLPEKAGIDLRDTILKTLSADSALARQRGGKASYDLLVLAEWTNTELLLRWAMSNMPITAEEQLELACMDGNARYQQVINRLSD